MVELNNEDATCDGAENPLGLNVPFVPYKRQRKLCSLHGSGGTRRLEEYLARWCNVRFNGRRTRLVMDEGLGWSLYYQGLRGVTAKTEARFRAPILVGTLLVITAFTCERTRRIVRARAEVRRADEGAELFVELNATMYLIEEAQLNTEQQC